MPRIRTPRAQATEPARTPAPLPAPVLIPHVYRDFDPGGAVLPNKRYTLELPEAAAGAVAAHVAVIPHSAAASDAFRVEAAAVHDGHLHVEFAGRGVVGGISVLFHVVS